MVEFHADFPHSYKVEDVGEFPGTGQFKEPLFYFPRLKDKKEHEGWWLKITSPNGLSWIGIFESGYAPSPASSQVVSYPDPNRLCVVSQGAAYIVNANDPDDWNQVATSPVLDVQAVIDAGLLIFSDFISLSAYSKEGLAWESPRVCWDDLRILKVTQNTIEGIGYDPINNEPSPFAVDLETGRSLLPAPKSTDGRSVW